MPTLRHRHLLFSGRPRFNDSRFGTLLGWYDFFDTSCLFQESGTGAATTAVTGLDDPIGRVVNKVAAGPYLYATADSRRGLRKAYGSSFSARLDGVDDYYVSSDTNYWKFMHDGTGCTVLMQFSMTDNNPTSIQSLLDNMADGSANIGVGLLYRGDAAILNSAEFQWSRGVGGAPAVTFTRTAANTIPSNGTSNILDVVYRRTSGTNYIDAAVGGSSVLSITGTNAPSTSNPSFALQVGALAS
jgi:hypothetical protein